MRILETKAYEGKNIYSFTPVIRMVVDLAEFTNRTTDQFPDFTKELVKTLPSLREHYCSKGIPGGFIRRLEEGTLLGHVVEHVALELQSLAGASVIYGKTRSTNKLGIYEIVFEYGVQETGILAGQRALDLVCQILAGKSGDSKEIIKELVNSNACWGFGPSTEAILKAAKKKDIPVLVLDNNGLLQLGYGKQQKRIGATITSATGCLAVDIASDKALTKDLLYDAGVPVSLGQVVSNLEELETAFAGLKKPVVIKPLNGNHGKGVSVDIKNFQEAKRAFGLALNYSKKVIIEEHISGHQYRILVVGDSIIAVAERVPPYVIGDGCHSIEELVKLINLDPRRGEGHEKFLTKVKLDSVVDMTLSKRGLNLQTVLPMGEKVYLRESANLSTGAFSIDVTDKLHSDFKEMALRAAKAIGLDVAGIDLIAKDVSLPCRPHNGVVIEVNAAPGLRMHLNPQEGSGRPCGEAIVEHLFKFSTGRIPIISVTGTNGKTTTVRLIAGILAASGLKVGMTTTDGIYIGKKIIMAGDMAGPKSAKALLKNSEVEVAVLETARGGIIRGGLGYDHSDVGVITNISEDHLGQDGIDDLEDLAYVKSLVIEAVKKRGYAVLNADDPYVMGLVSRTRCKIIYFSSINNNVYIKRHLGAGGKAVFINKGYVVYAEGNRLQKVAHVKEIPVTLGGIASHNIQNVLAATASALALGLKLEEIKKGLSSFSLSLQDNPGRLNIFDLRGYKVVVDYGHNEAAYANTIEILKKMKHKRLVGIIGVPGDRTDHNILEVGKIAGQGFDNIYIKEDQDLRGRQPGEVAEFLQKGILATNFKADKIKIILDEKEALGEALRLARAGDIIVVFYEKLAPILQILDKEIQQSAKKSVLRSREKLIGKRNNIV